MQESLLKADIFFVITSVVVIIIGIVSLVAGIYIVHILRTLKKISQIVHDESVKVQNDITDIRETVRENGASIKTLGKIFKTIKKYKK